MQNFPYREVGKMKKLGGRFTFVRFGASLALLAGIMLVVQSPTPSNATTSSQRQTLLAFVKKNTSQPIFTAPGPAFDAKKAKGKTVFFISNSSAVAFNVSAADATKSALAAVGVKTTIYPTTGEVSQYQTGIETAITEKASEIILLSIDPSLLGPQINAAKAAGVPTIVVHTGSANYKPPSDVAAAVPAPYTLAGQLEAAYAIANSSTPDILIVGETADIAGRSVTAGITSYMAKYCPSCKTTTLNVPVPSWATEIQPEVASALVKDPKINYILSDFDFEVQYIEPALTAAGNHSVKIATYNGTPFVLQNIEQKKGVTMDVGESAGWLGWAFADEALRVLTGSPLVKNENTPVRLWDAANVSLTGTPPIINKGYSSAYIAGYKKLWGLSS